MLVLPCLTFLSAAPPFLFSVLRLWVRVCLLKRRMGMCFACVPLPAAHLCAYVRADPNHVECSAGGAEFTLAIHGRSSKVTLSTMEARLPLEAFEVCSRALYSGSFLPHARARAATVADVLTCVRMHVCVRVHVCVACRV